MLHKVITVSIWLMIFFISALFYANLSPVFFKSTEAKYLSYNDVLGVSFVFQGKEYPLNFNQQNQFLISLNQEMTNRVQLSGVQRLSSALLQCDLSHRFDKSNLMKVATSRRTPNVHTPQTFNCTPRNPLLLEILDLEKVIVYRFQQPNLIIEN